MPRTIGAKDKQPRKRSAPKTSKSTVQKVNWEELARNLQKALRDEIVENQRCANHVDSLLFKIKSLEHQAVGFQAVISYLETKCGNDTV